MNTRALLALIADLYNQICVLSEENQELRDKLEVVSKADSTGSPGNFGL